MANMRIPADFPQFKAKGFDRQMSDLRDLYWKHYERGGPLIPLWDEWVTVPTLWPATRSSSVNPDMCKAWREALLGRIIDSQGYVYSQQHGSIAHQGGWPFPMQQPRNPGTWGCYFSEPVVPPGYFRSTVSNQEGWTVTRANDIGIADGSWQLKATGADCVIEPTIAAPINTFLSPFLQLRWSALGIGADARPYVQWITEDDGEYDNRKMMYFDPADSTETVFTMIPVYRNPAWNGTVTGLRIRFGNLRAGQLIRVSAFFTQYDTRHNINNANFIRGSVYYFDWTFDLNFLRANIERMRMALLYAIKEYGCEKYKCVVTPYIGHNGKPGFTLNPDGTKTIHFGDSVGSNYWDILPCGYMDAYATVQMYHALLKYADFEDIVSENPHWNIPDSPLKPYTAHLRKLAAEIKDFAGKLFWNAENRRFTLGLDIDGNLMKDYGYVFLNLEAVYYGFATDEQARDIFDWISGKRIVEGDTSVGEDIYRFRFGPRATTKRNIDFYFFGWTGPERIKFGDQIQDGGCVLGFTLFDLMGRLKIYGADDAWARLMEIMEWYNDVEDAGGPLEYYKDGTRGTLQGNNRPGGLGIEYEFFESILVPQIMLYGFLGLRADSRGVTISPVLPDALGGNLTVTNINYRGTVFDAAVNGHNIIIKIKSGDKSVLDLKVADGFGYRFE